MKHFLYTFILIVSLQAKTIHGQNNGDVILGTWYNQEQTSKIQIIKMNIKGITIKKIRIKLKKA